MSATLPRRRFVQWLGVACATGALPGRAQPAPRYMADMHSHIGMFMPNFLGFDLKEHMRTTGTTLLAWSITDDNRWIAPGPQGLKQVSQPQPGELWNNFRARLDRYTALLDKWGVAKALTPADIDAALAGEPRVLLATEAANFLEGDPHRVAQAHAWGIRHMQMVHYIDSPLGDHQTAQPRHAGITEPGRQVIRECNRLGIVVDLAHASPAFVDAALEVAKAPVVWSHSGSAPRHGRGRRRLTCPARCRCCRRARSPRGGAMGLWSVRVRGDPAYAVHNVRTFADETVRMCDLVGPEHVAFGTDMEGAGPGPILSDYGDLLEVAVDLARRGLPDAMLHGIFIGNYVRIAKAAMTPAS